MQLTPNAEELLRKSYYRKDKDGNIIENWEGLCRRVANHIAKGDYCKDYEIKNTELTGYIEYTEHLYNRKNEKDRQCCGTCTNYLKCSTRKDIEYKFFDLLYNQYFIVNTPSLMNSGTELGGLSACFEGTQPILTSKGIKAIKDISIGDTVITHKGKFKKVSECFSRNISDNLYKIDIQGLLSTTLAVTEEHPILAIKKSDIKCIRHSSQICNGFSKIYCFKRALHYKNDCFHLNDCFTKPSWIQAKELSEGDFVVVSSGKEILDIPELLISDVVNNQEFIRDGDFLKSVYRKHTGKLIPNKIPIDSDFMRMIGFWLANGSLSKRGKKLCIIRFTFNRKHENFCDDILSIMKSKFNLEAVKEYTPTQQTMQLRFSSVIVANFFNNLLGKGFDGKYLPDWFLTLPYEKQFNLLVGLFRGDGCHYNGIKGVTSFCISFSNRKLSLQVWEILTRLGYTFNISVKKPKLATTEAYGLTGSINDCLDLIEAVGRNEIKFTKGNPVVVKSDGFILRPIKKITKEFYQGPVYNLEVEDDHSYIANGVVVHNCFTVDVADSMESILQAIKNTGLTLKTGGGVGISLAKLRSVGSKIGSTGGESSGVISWLNIFNTVVEEVKQGGRRRGAMLAALPIDHPQILEFIDCKNDGNKITNFNLSIAITDEFMQKVSNNDDYDLIDPHTKKVTNKINAKEIFNKICESTWLTGDPGILFIDTINKDNPIPKTGEILSSNPCILSSTLFLTMDRGVQPLSELRVGDVVWTGTQWSPLLNIWSTGIKPVYRYTTSNGFSIDLTEDHKVVQDSIKIAVRDAQSVDGSTCTVEFGGTDVEENFALLAGLVQGDGSMQKNGGVSAYLNIGKNDNAHFNYISKYIDSPASKTKKYLYKLNVTFADLYIDYAPLPDRTISDFWMATNSKTMKLFLKGLFSANGCFIKSANRIALKSTNLDLIKKVQIMLSAAGIRSYYTINKPSAVKWDNGTYTSKMSYDLNITSDIIKFKNEIGFTQQYKMDAITAHISNGRTNLNKIKNKEYLGNLEVFDFTVEADEHTVWANGLLISNCGEFLLPPANSCTLGAINLSKIITTDGKNWRQNDTLFSNIISTAVRMLDNTITMNKFPIPEIEKVTLANRPIGLGFLNLSEYLIKMGLVYGSDDSLKAAEDLTRRMRKRAIESSIELAKGRGSYPNFDLEDWSKVNCAYVDKFDKDFVGVRNSTVLSIAPNGSTGVIVNASSGGVEPIFAVSYKRKTVDCGDMHMVNPLFDERMLYIDDNHRDKVLTAIEENSGSVKGLFATPTNLQKLFVTAREIPYNQHIKMQAAVQKHVDNGVSKTINMFNVTTVEDVKNAYLMAHELKCKGITIYREGSRGNEVLSTKKKEDNKEDATTLETINRIEKKKELYSSEDYPKEIEDTEDTYEDDDFIPEVRERKDPVIGYTYKISIHNLKIYITINYNEDEYTPIECFVSAGKPGDDINAIAQSISRLISLGLKFRVPIDEIIQQLDSLAGEDVVWMSGDKILSIPDAVAKVLKWSMEKRKIDYNNTIRDNEPKSINKDIKYKSTQKSMFKNICPNCCDELVFQEGCRKCLSCQYNKCG